MNDIPKLIDDYIDTRLAYDDAKEASNDADRVHKVAKAKLVEAMTVDQQPGMQAERNGLTLSFSLRNQFSIACNEDNEAGVKEWLHETYGDLNEFTHEKLHKPAIVEKLKTEIESDQLDEFEVPDCFELKTRPDVYCSGYIKLSATRNE